MNEKLLMRARMALLRAVSDRTLDREAMPLAFLDDDAKTIGVELAQANLARALTEVGAGPAKQAALVAAYGYLIFERVTLIEASMPTSRRAQTAP